MAHKCKKQRYLRLKSCFYCRKSEAEAGENGVANNKKCDLFYGPVFDCGN